MNRAGHGFCPVFYSEKSPDLCFFTRKYGKIKKNAELAKERRLQDALLSIKKQFGKNAVLKAMSLQEGATAKDRNQ